MKALCSSSEKLLKAAVVERDLGDMEKAYINYFKYIECVNLIKKRQEYRSG